MKPNLQVAVVLVVADEDGAAIGLCKACNGSHKVTCGECGEDTKTCAECSAIIRELIITPEQARGARADLLLNVYDDETKTVVGVLCDDYPGAFLAYDDAVSAFAALALLRTMPDAWVRAAFGRTAAA